jgi:hypothetical protein
MRPPVRGLYFFVSTLLVLFLAASPLVAQKKGKPSAKKAETSKAASKKKEDRARDAKKDARKGSKKEQLAKKGSKSDDRRDRAADRKRDKKDNKKLSAKERRQLEREERAKKDDRRDAKADKKGKKSLAERRREEAERRAAEEARRQAILAERRRREQAAREARERQLAFERGLRNETQENILHDNTDGEDINVRRAAVSALGNRAGTVVVMEAKTGKVVTIVNQDWAIRNSFKPCSTIKLVTGVGGINERVISEDGHILGSNGMVLQDALARSNNPYFQRVGSNFGNKKMVEYAKDLGLGEQTGINADGETPGRLPYGNSNARIYSHGDDTEVTPLQLAVMVSAISNGGKKVVPQIVRDRMAKTTFRPVVKDQIDLPHSSYEGVLPGMVGAAEYGTARRGVDASQGIAGKTGSCIFKGTWIGLFASVAPVEDPKYSVVVITRGGSERGKYAAAVAGQVYRALAPQIHRNRDLAMAKGLMRSTRPIDGTTARADEDEDDDDAAAQTETATTANADDAIDRTVPAPIVVGSRQIAPSVPVTEQKKLIQKTTQSKPVNLRPVVIEYDRSGAEKVTRPRIVKNK